jgi:hypothetical protein
MRVKKILSLLAIFLTSTCVSCMAEKNEGDVEKFHDTYEDGGLLFAHMTKSDYGRLYYSISKDGIVWQTLNKGKRISSEYYGHPDIIKGADGRYYMISGRFPDGTNASLFVSSDLITWEVETTISKDQVFNGCSGYTGDDTYFGAPKLFYDEDSEQYIITWHASKGTVQDFTKMKTLYTLTKDFKTYTKPQFLFDFKSEADKDIVTIDVIIRKINDKYWAILKDERDPETCKTGKTIRISYSDELTGPYSEPSAPITPTWFEAPTIAEAPDGKGWFIWAENYPYQYYRFKAEEWGTTGWKKDPRARAGMRHGCVVRINQEQYDAILERFK